MPKSASSKFFVPHTVAEDVMSSNLVVVHPDDTWRTAVELMTRHRLTGLLVVNTQGKFLGLLNERDILSACSSLDNPTQGVLDEKINYKKSVRTVRTTTPIDDVRSILAGKSFRHIPVLNPKGKLEGIITRRDLIRILYLRSELSKTENTV